jgi:hypothetical protein
MFAVCYVHIAHPQINATSLSQHSR